MQSYAYKAQQRRVKYNRKQQRCCDIVSTRPKTNFEIKVT